MIGKRTANFCGQAFSRLLVDHNQQPKSMTVLGPICQKFVRPSMILVADTVTRATNHDSGEEASQAMLFPQDLTMLTPPNSMDTYLVHRPAWQC